MTTFPPTLSLADIEAARDRIAGGIRRTPCLRLPAVPELSGVEIWLKRDDLQRTRSFKERGALNALLGLDQSSRRRGVVTASAGNHALGLAFHGSRLGIKVTVVMPVTVSPLKLTRCRGLGADVLLHGRSFEEAEVRAVQWAAQSGASLVHPFDDIRVIAGQGTMALEILEQVSRFGALVLPVGGGGLLAGAAAAVKSLRADVQVIAVQSDQARGFDAARRHGGPVPVPVGATLADGMAVACIGQTSFAIAEPLVDQIVTVTEREIVAAISLLARRAGIVAEGAGAAGLAAVLAGRVSARIVVVPVTGGNIDPQLHERAVGA